LPIRAELIDELDRPRAAIRGEATDPYFPVGSVVEGRKATRTNDPATVPTKLRAAGARALSIAEKLGLAAATEAIKRAIA